MSRRGLPVFATVAAVVVLSYGAPGVSRTSAFDEGAATDAQQPSAASNPKLDQFKRDVGLEVDEDPADRSGGVGEGTPAREDGELRGNGMTVGIEEAEVTRIANGGGAGDGDPDGDGLLHAREGAGILNGEPHTEG